MKFKILAGLFVVALSLVVLQATAQMHQHNPQKGGVVVMFGNADHAEISKAGSGFVIHLSDANRNPLKVSDFDMIKAVLVKDSKEIELKPRLEKDSSSLNFELPPDDFSKAGLKITLKRKKGDTYSQALPLAKVP